MLVCNKVYLQNEGSISVGDDFWMTSDGGLNPICRNIRASIVTSAKDARIEIGDRVGVSSACIWARHLIKIGNDVNIGGDCLIMDHDAHPHDYLKRRRPGGGKIPFSEIVIDEDVWIGARCQILKGVHIGARSIIASGSIVTKDIPCDVIAGGIPCRVIRKLN